MPLEYRMMEEEESIKGIFGVMFRELGELTEPKLDSYIEKNPDDIKGYITKALFLQKKNPNQGLGITEDGLEKFGENYLLYHVKGVLYELSGQRNLAIESFKKAIELNSINIESIMSLGTLYNRLGEHVEAINYWKQVIEMNPGLDAGWFGLSRSEFFTSDYERALKHMNAALFTAPKDDKKKRISYRANRAEIYLKLDDIEHSLEDIEYVYKFDPREALGILKFGISNNFKENRKSKESVPLLEKLLELAPDGGGDLELYLVLGSLYTKNGEIEKINELFEKGIKSGLDPDQITKMRDYQGMVLMEAKLFDESIKVYEDLIKKTGELAYGINIIQMAQFLGDNVKAEKYKAMIKENKALVQKLTQKFGDRIIMLLEDKRSTNSKNIGRNDPCPCGSGLKFKKCCGN